MFSIGMGELVIILVIALIIFGPSRLPEVGRTIGRAMAEMNRATKDIKQTMNEAVEEELEQDRKSRIPAKPTQDTQQERDKPQGGNDKCLDDSAG